MFQYHIFYYICKCLGKESPACKKNKQKGGKNNNILSNNIHSYGDGQRKQSNEKYESENGDSSPVYSRANTYNESGKAIEYAVELAENCGVTINSGS